MNILIHIFLLLSSVLLTNIAVAQPGANCQIKHENVNLLGKSVYYNQAGRGESLLLLHGLFGNKEQWKNVICALAHASYSVIAIDLPGFGESQHFPMTIYPLEEQVTLLHQLLEALDIDKVHIAGSSMGGAIAALYAEKYPTQVSTLIFWGSPLGIVPYAQPFKEAIYQGVNPLIPTTPEEFSWETRLLFVRPPVLPKPVIRKKVQDYRVNNKKYIQIWNIVNLYVDVLNRDLSFNQPVLILWGDKDDIFDVSGAKKLANQFNTEEISVVILSDTGHLPYYDVPDLSAQSVVAFLQQKKGNRSRTS